MYAWTGGESIDEVDVIYNWDPKISNFAGRVLILSTGKACNAFYISKSEADCIEYAAISIREKRERLERELTSLRSKESSMWKKLSRHRVADLPFGD